MAFFLSAFLMCLAITSAVLATFGLAYFPLWLVSKIEDSERVPAWLRSFPAGIAIFIVSWSFEIAVVMTILRAIHPYIRG